MFDEKQFEEARNCALSQIARVQAMLTSVKYPKPSQFSIDLRDMTAEQITEELDEVPSGHSKKDRESDYIYIIELKSGIADQAKMLTTKLVEARRTASDYCRVNEENSSTHTLYVGRSKTLRGRLRQHLGFDSQGVYAMHLSRWATGQDVDLLISYMKFEAADDLLIQAIEDGLWEFLKPAFGRKGER